MRRSVLLLRCDRLVAFWSKISGCAGWGRVADREVQGEYVTTDGLRTAVVSGGGSGIGQAIARSLFADGYDVVILGRRRENLDAAIDTITSDSQPTRGSLFGVTGDLADPSSVERIVGDVVGRFGRPVDVVVANAGRPAKRPAESLESVQTAWRDAIEGNTLPAVLLVEGLKPHLSDSSRIVFISSAAASGHGGGAYGGAKAALHSYMFDLAVELGPAGVTSNVVAPGFIADTELFGGRLTPERTAAFVDRTLVKRAGLPPDVAAAVRWLASEQAGYVTAQVIGIDGGALIDPN